MADDTQDKPVIINQPTGGNLGFVVDLGGYLQASNLAAIAALNAGRPAGPTVPVGGVRTPRPGPVAAPKPAPAPVPAPTPAPTPTTPLDDLLGKPLTPPELRVPATPELDALLTRDVGSGDLARLLSQDFVPGAAAEATGGGLLARLGAYVNPVVQAIGLLLYSTDAGVPGESDFALQQLLSSGGLPYEPNIPPPRPVEDNPGLTEFVPNVGYISPEPVTVTAPAARTPPAVDAPSIVGFPPVSFGNPTLVGPVPAPRPFGPGGGPRSLTTPGPVSRPLPRTKPAPSPLLGSAPGLPTITGNPTPNKAPKPQTPVALHPQPLLVAAPCECQKGTKKKKPKKKRTKCYKGTYYELTNGLRKYKREEIPCR